MLYPWDVICRYLLRHGKVDCRISGLENIELEALLDRAATGAIRDIQLQIDNPDLTDSEKVAYVRAVLSGIELPDPSF